MADARTSYILSYALAAVIVLAGMVLCIVGKLTTEQWFQCVLASLAALGLTHMPSPAELVRRSGSLGPMLALLLLGCGLETHTTITIPKQAKQQIDAQGIATDYVSMSQRLQPSAPGRGIVYTDSQTGKVRFVNTLGGWIEMGMADKVFTAITNPLSPAEGWIYTNTISHKLFYYNGTTWAEIGQIPNQVPTSRLINTTAPLSGGGDLSADRTLSLVLSTNPGLYVSGGGLSLLAKPSGGLATDALGAYVVYGNVAGTSTQGNDNRLNPTPSTPGGVVFDSGAAYVITPAGTSSDVLRGGTMPTFGPIPAGAIPNTTVVAGSYPTVGQIPTFTVGSDGRLTAAGSTDALTAPVVSGTVTGTYSLGGTPSLASTLNASNQDITNMSSIIFGGQSTQPYIQGQLYYNNDKECLSFHNDESNITMDIGQEVWVRVRNESGSSILNGKAVYINGNHPGTGLPTIALAQANSAATSQFLGLVTHDIPNNSIGYVTVVGQVSDLNTSGFSNGDVLYLSSASAGDLTATPPSAPNFIVISGIVTKATAMNGSIFTGPRQRLQHASTHQPGGSDPLPTAIAVDTGTANVVGSSTSFSRADHVHRDVILQTAEFHLTADVTTTSGTPVDMTGATVSVTTQASTKLAINCSFSTSTSSALGATTNVLLNIDGSTDSGVGQTFPALSGSGQGAGFSRLKTGLSAASHTIKLQWFTSAGTARIRAATVPNSEHASCYVQETRL